jgi:hypothetical protein
MWFGIMAFFNPLKILADIVPLLGDLVGVSIALVAGLAALVLSFMTIAVAWMYYRPLVGGALVTAAVLAGYGILHHMRDVKAKKTPPPATGIPPQRLAAFMRQA